MEPGFAVCELARDTPATLGRVGTVKKWDMLIADVSEPEPHTPHVSNIAFHPIPNIEDVLSRLNSPMYLARVLEETERDTMHRRITPPLVEETSSTVQVIKVVFIRLTPPEFHVGNFEIAPEMTRRITVGLLVMLGPAKAVGEPIQGVVLMEVFGVLGQELDRLGPQGRDGLGRIVEGDGEAVRFIVVLHVTEHVVVDVAEEADVRFDAPVIPRVLERRMFIEHAAIPSAHRMVRELISVLDFFLFKNLDGFLV